MLSCEALPASAEASLFHERRAEPRENVAGTLWLVDHSGSTVLRCRCLESSPSGMRLRVPLGYGIAEGQRYELRSHLPGRQPAGGFGVVASRWATIVRTQVRIGEDEDHLDVGVSLDITDQPALWLSATTSQV